MDHGEDDCVAADDERDERDGAEAYSGRSCQDAEARPEIGEQVLHRGPRPHTPSILGDERDVAEFENRLAARFIRGHPSIDVVLRLAIKMILDVLVEAVERSFAAHRHHSCAVGRRIRPTARASVSHLLVSICSCLRPLEVSA